MSAEKAKDALEVGDKMEDGTIYAGMVEIAGQAPYRLYAVPADAPMVMSFNAAAKYAKGLQVGDKKDFRVPSKAELNVLFQNKEKGALKGTFNLTGSIKAGWCWSSTPYGIFNAWQQRFSDGRQDIILREGDASVRCVR